MNVNVYDQIAANGRRTVFILCAFPAALFAIIFLILLFIDKTEALDLTMVFFPWIFLVAFLWIVFSYFRGGEMILNMTHATPVTFDENRELFRLVENTAIMTGLPTPKIYLIEEESLNAFATGRKPETASIALTSGLVKRLDNAELQAVIAHELAHIGNRDTRLMIIIIAGIGCFTVLGEIFLRSAFRGSGGSKKSGKGALVVLAIGIALLVFGYLIAPIIRLALSRRREYQADSTAAKITRDPEALVRALLKIADHPRVVGLDASPLVGNMCIANPAEAGFVSRLFSTHPPIEDRITALGKMTIRGTALFNSNDRTV